MPYADPEVQRTHSRERYRERIRREQGRTIGVRNTKKLEIVYDYPEGVERPKTRGECAGGARPCPWASCRHHLYADVNQAGGLKLNFPNVEPEDMDRLPATCSLDVADAGLARLEDAGVLMNLTRERVRQVEVVALRKLSMKRVMRELSK